MTTINLIYPPPCGSASLIPMSLKWHMLHCKFVSRYFSLLTFSYLVSYSYPQSPQTVSFLVNTIFPMLLVTKSAPHHLTWREFPSFCEEISAQYPCNPFWFPPTLPGDSLSLEWVRDPLSPFCVLYPMLWTSLLPIHYLWHSRVLSTPYMWKYEETKQL